MPKAKFADTFVLEKIKKNQPLSVYKLAKILVCSYSTVHRLVLRMERDKLIESYLKEIKTVRRMVIVKDDK